MAENAEPKYKASGPKGPAKTYSFTFSLPGMISAVGASVLVLTFFFVMGILIGRGYRPEADVPPLGDIMPRKEHGELAGEPVKPEILKAEDLEYPERLKEPAAKRMDQGGEDIINPEPKIAPKPKDTTVYDAPAPGDSTLENPQPASEVIAPAIAPEPERPAQSNGEPVFDYVYQVASFREAGMAKTFSNKLVAAGLKTSIAAGDVKGTTWHRVQVHYHGTAASTEGLKATLSKLGIKKPFLKSKTASK